MPDEGNQIDLFVNQCLDTYCKRMETLYQAAPPEVRDHLMEQLSRTPGQISDTQIAPLAKWFPGPAPQGLVAYVKQGLKGGVDHNEYCIPGVDVDDLEHCLNRFFLDGGLVKFGYLPFASGPCGDPVCFDLLEKSSGGDYPVVCFNHDMIPQSAWEQRTTLAEYAEEVAGSFEAFLEMLCNGEGPEF